MGAGRRVQPRPVCGIVGESPTVHTSRLRLSKVKNMETLLLSSNVALGPLKLRGGMLSLVLVPFSCHRAMAWGVECVLPKA